MEEKFVLKMKHELREVGARIGLILQIIGFLLVAAVIAAIGTAIGALIGGVAGLWSGPGAFFTALAGGIAGAAAGWALAIVIIASCLGVGVTGIGFGFLMTWPQPPQENQEKKDYEPYSKFSIEQIEDLAQKKLSKESGPGVLSAVELEPLPSDIPITPQGAKFGI